MATDRAKLLLPADQPETSASAAPAAVGWGATGTVGASDVAVTGPVAVVARDGVTSGAVVVTGAAVVAGAAVVTGAAVEVDPPAVAVVDVRLGGVEEWVAPQAAIEAANRQAARQRQAGRT